MAEPTHHDKALALLAQANEADEAGNPDRAALLTAQAQVFATLHNAYVHGAATDQFAKQLRSALDETNVNLEDIVRRMPAS